MNFTINENKAFGSLEITFEGKPDENTRNALKSYGFRWNPKRGLWYGYGEEAEIRKAIEGGTVEKKAEKADKKPAVDREALTAEYEKVWKTPGMVKYCVSKVARVATLPTGEIIPIEKQSIETRFCFGESGYDYEDAAKMAAHARTNEEYFFNENMKSFRDMIRDLEEAKKDCGNYKITIGAAYTGQSEDCKIRYMGFVKLWKVLEWCGGSADLETLPGREFDNPGHIVRIATREEIEIILEEYKAAAADHEKKVKAYLKRYGLSKVHSWTYWRDA